MLGVYVGEVNVGSLGCCVVLRCCFGIARSSLLERLSTSLFWFISLHRSSVNLGIATSSAKKLPRRVVHLNKGEEEMVF